MDILWFALLMLIAVAGIGLAVFQLPGTWLILAAALAYDWHYDWQPILWPWLVVLSVIALAAEVAETLSGAVVAGRAGASRRASVGAFIGGILGMVFLSLPAPIVGTIAGGMLGCFLGALAGEMTLHSDVAKGTRIGIHAAIGRLLGLLFKSAAACVIAGAVVVQAARWVW